ncbi:adhesion G-protein coupled receptor G2 isoform X1 [Hydra vulgaris]|uniref:adhesion G-protein coupled receptor G2 isoform X1 n=1 Tax=Hydra vulgaris TaxID=6087 RepID=UPI001F5F111E|nr:adhesion G-protein coupled receptor G2-like isoform X2 [Hydra vulgaris]
MHNLFLMTFGAVFLAENTFLLTKNDKMVKGDFNKIVGEVQNDKVVQRVHSPSLKQKIWEHTELLESSNPTTKILQYFSKQPICVDTSTTNCSLIGVVSKTLSEIVANGSVITNYHDVNFITIILENIVSAFLNATATEQVFIDVLQTIDNVLDSNVTFIAESQIKTFSSTRILKILTEFALIFSKQLNNSISFCKINIGFHIKKVEKGNIIISAQQLPDNSVKISFNNDAGFIKKAYVVMTLPSDVFYDENEVIYSYFFRYDFFLLDENYLIQLVKMRGFNQRFLQSTILSASVVNRNVSNLSNPIVIKFKKTHKSLGTSSCKYWDENVETGIANVYGKWLTTGCYRNESEINNDFFTCSCDHLTNFAVLLDINQNSDNPLALKIIAYIGCGVSLLGLGLSLLTLATFRNLRKKLPQKILICLCISLMGLLLVFLIGAEKTSPRQHCQIIAAALHYFILTTFCWMLVEAFNFHRSLIAVFNRSSDESIFRNANVIAWGVPALIVIITGILKPDQLGNHQICVVRGNPFYFTVLLPVCLILLINFIVLVIIMLSLSTKNEITNKVTGNKNNISRAKISFMCSTLLGSSWIFGVLAVKDFSTVFQWLFCVSTSLQGFFIFVFYILRNKKVFVEFQFWLLRYRQYKVSSNVVESNINKK